MEGAHIQRTHSTRCTYLEYSAKKLPPKHIKTIDHVNLLLFQVRLEIIFHEHQIYLEIATMDPVLKSQ